MNKDKYGGNEFMFLGKPAEYWIEVDAGLKEKGYEDLIEEIVKLRAKVSYYESRIIQMSEFMELKIVN